MIMVRGKVDGEEYTEPFSKGILSRSLIRAELSPDRAYELAAMIEAKIINKNISIIDYDDLLELIINILKEKEDSSVVKKYLDWRKIRNSKEPLIILIGGGSGVGTSSISFEVASKLGIKSMISTDMIREVMRKIVSKELSPVIHESSFSAHKSLRVTQPPELDHVLAGFKEHVGTVSLGVEAVIERALKEGISIIIEGVHIVPGFIRKDLMEKDNVIIFTLTVPDEEMHKNRFYSRCTDIWAHRPLQIYLDNFHAIRTIHSYFESQSKKEGVLIIENIDVVTTVDIIIKSITETMEIL